MKCPKCETKIKLSDIVDDPQRQIRIATCPGCQKRYRLKHKPASASPVPATDLSFQTPLPSSIPRVPTSPIKSKRPSKKSNGKSANGNLIAWVIGGLAFAMCFLVAIAGVVFVMTSKTPADTPDGDQLVAQAKNPVSVKAEEESASGRGNAKISGVSPDEDLTAGAKVDRKAALEFLDLILSRKGNAGYLEGQPVFVDATNWTQRKSQGPVGTLAKFPLRDRWFNSQLQNARANQTTPNTRARSTGDAKAIASLSKLEPSAPRATAELVTVSAPTDFTAPPVNPNATRPWKPLFAESRHGHQGLLLEYRLVPKTTPLKRDLVWNRVTPQGEKLDEVIIPDVGKTGSLPSLAEVSTGNSRICLSHPSQSSRLVFVDADSEQRSEFLPYGADVPVEQVAWCGEDRLMTVGDGRCTFWRYPELTVVSDFDGGYKGPAVVSNDGVWCAVSADDRIEILDIEAKRCLGRLKHPVIGQISDFDISPDGTRIATIYSNAFDEYVAFVWDLQNQKYAQMPTSLRLADEYYSAAKPHKNPVCRWVRNNELLILGESLLGLNLSSGKAAVDGIHRMALDWTREICIVQHQMTDIPAPTVKKQKNRIAYQICVSLPATCKPKSIALAYAAKLTEEGHTIGPGGNTVIITATAGSGGISLKPPGRGGKRILMPRVTYSATEFNSAGKVVGMKTSVADFAETKSRFYRGSSSSTNTPAFADQENYAFPPNYREAVLEEILRSSKGWQKLVGGFQEKKFEGVSKFRVIWIGFGNRVPFSVN